MKKIKLVQIITKLELGGAQKHVLDIVSGLDQNKYEITLVSASEGILNTEASMLKGVRFIRIKPLIREINLFKDIRALFVLRRLLKDLSPDIVHTHSSKAGIIGRLAAALAGVPNIVHTVHGFPFHPFQPFLISAVYSFLERFAGLFTSTTVFVNKRDMELSFKKGISTPNKSRVIYCGIEKSAYVNTTEKGIAKKILGYSPDSLIVGTIACYKRQKGLYNVIIAAKYIKEKGVRFLLIGDGAQRKLLEETVFLNALTERCELLGWHRDIKQLLNAFDIFVLPSLWEGLPISVMEAMAAGLPIVTSDVGGIRELVEEGYNGFICPPNDPEFLSQKIDLLLNDHQLCLTMGRNSLNKIKNAGHFEKSYMLKEIDTLYGSFINR